MRRLFSLAALALVATVLPVAQGSPVPPGFASANVEWLANVPIHADSAGGRIVGNVLYIADSRSVTLYSLSDPELPTPVGVLPLPEAPYFPQEDLDTNGEILIIGQGSPNPTGFLHVVDVTFPHAPTLLASLRGASSHTVSCVLDCTWVYNSNGQIVDLREPATPKLAGRWLQAGVDGAHDVTEVRPGIVLTSSNPMLLLDARKNPAKPTLLAKAAMPDDRFIHANLWPNGGTDKMMLVGGETSGTPCSDKAAGAFMTWDATQVGSKRSMRMLDEYRAPNGLPTTGGFPVETYCSHWFTTQPGYRNGGLVAVGWYEHGTRFLNVAGNGKIKETGWFIPVGTTASATYFVGQDLVYLLDYNRGLDIVRYHSKPQPHRALRRARPGELLPTEAPLFTRRLVPSYGARSCPVPTA